MNFRSVQEHRKQTGCQTGTLQKHHMSLPVHKNPLNAEICAQGIVYFPNAARTSACLPQVILPSGHLPEMKQVGP